MRKTIITAAEVQSSKWAGGSSKQYYIQPPASTYSERNFAFRLSMATSDNAGEAPYSYLPNITRHLIMLEGEAQVFHQEHYNLTMHPYQEIDVFDGGWISSGSGMVTDFNLMTSAGVHGKMSVVKESYVCSIGNKCDECGKIYNYTAFLCYKGSASIKIGNESHVLNSADLIILEPVNYVIITIETDNTKLVRMDICHHDNGIYGG